MSDELDFAPPGEEHHREPTDGRIGVAIKVPDMNTFNRSGLPSVWGPVVCRVASDSLAERAGILSWRHDSGSGWDSNTVAAWSY